MQRIFFFVALCSVAFLVAGCGEEPAAVREAEKNREVIEQLPPEDREAALEQAKCPVCGEALGSKGPPVKAEVGGQTMFFDTQSCADSFVRAPAKYRSKLTE
ncbi:MAG: hypothetical protein GX575_23355 [Candidatus Anammoximicrobium sp.]|nr:hypothetical protein [Candidatus Anammoximicrobium sp.]